MGIGTLYRNFPNRQALLEAVYLDEVQALCATVADLEGLSPWDALVRWLHRFVDYMVTKQALAPERASHCSRAPSRQAPFGQICPRSAAWR